MCPSCISTPSAAVVAGPPRGEQGLPCPRAAFVAVLGLVPVRGSIGIAVGLTCGRERFPSAGAAAREGVWAQTDWGSRNPAFSPHAVAGVNPLSSLSRCSPPVTFSPTLHPFCLFRLENSQGKNCLLLPVFASAARQRRARASACSYSTCCSLAAPVAAEPTCRAPTDPINLGPSSCCLCRGVGTRTVLPWHGSRAATSRTRSLTSALGLAEK